jgi:hypothetical protein
MSFLKIRFQQFFPVVLGALYVLVGNTAIGQWYTDPHNPVAVYEWIGDNLSPLVPDLNGGAYFFGTCWFPHISHVELNGQWSCPLPGVPMTPSSWMACFKSIVDPENNLIYYAENGDPYFPCPAILRKFSPTGQALMSFTFPNQYIYPIDILSDGTSGCIALIYQSGVGYSIQKFDSSGQPHYNWTENQLENSGEFGAEIISDGFGGAFACWKVERESEYSIQMQHIRPDGSFAFGSSGLNLAENHYAFIPSLPGSFILGTAVGPPWEFHIIRFDSSGSVIWDHIEQPFDWHYFISDNLGGMYLFGFEDDSTYARINAESEMIFSGYHLPVSPLGNYTFFTVSPKGELVLLYLNESDEFWALQKYDSLGNQVWPEAVPVLYGMQPGSNYQLMTADTRGGVILCFAFSYQPLSGTYFTRVDAYGNVGSGLYVNQTPIPVPGTFQIIAYPNPFNNQINLTWKTNPGGMIWLNITNLLGQRIISTQLPTHTTHFIWDGRDAWGTPVSSGTYYATIQKENIRKSLSITLIK